MVKYTKRESARCLMSGRYWCKALDKGLLLPLVGFRPSNNGPDVVLHVVEPVFTARDETRLVQRRQHGARRVR
jgi:hypothetical protein